MVSDHDIEQMNTELASLRERVAELEAANEQAQVQLAVGKQHQRLFSQKLLALHNASITLSQVKTLAELYRGAVELGLGELGFDRIALFMVDADKQHMQGTFGTDPQGRLRAEYDIDYKIPAEDWILEILEGSERVYLSQDSPLYEYGQVVDRGWHAAAGVWDGQSVIGCLFADNLRHHQPLQVHEVDLLGLYGIALGHLISQKRAELARQEAELWAKSTFEQAAVGIAHVSIEGVILRINQRFCELLGYSESELIGCDFRDISHPEDLDKDLCYIEQAMRGEIDTYSLEKRYICKDGTLLWTDLTVSLVNDDQGHLQYAIGVIQNISERKQAEQLLSEREQWFRAIVSYLNDVVLILDRENRIQYITPSVTPMLGYDPADLIGKDGAAFVHPDDWRHSQDELTRITSGERWSGASLFRFLHKDGHWVQVEALATDYLSDPVIQGVLVFAHDVGEREQMIVALQESEFKYRQVIENANEVILVVQDGHIKLANDKSFDLIGYSMQELESDSFIDLIYDEDREMVAGYHAARLQGQPAPDVYQMRVKSKSGSIYWTEVRSVFIEWEGRPGTLSFISDITDRREAERLLRESEEKYRNLVERANDGIIIVQNGLLEYVNPRIAEIVGMQIQDMMNTPFVGYILPECLPQVLSFYQRRMAGQSVPQVYETRILRSDGQVVNVELNADVIMYNDQHADLVFVHDLTERQQVRQRIEQLLNHQVTVNQLALALGNLNELDQIYRTIDEQIRILLDVYVFIISFYDAPNSLTRAGYISVGGVRADAEKAPPVPIHRQSGPQAEVILNGELVYLPDCTERWSQSKIRYVLGADGDIAPASGNSSGPVLSALLVPMKIGGQVIGVMQVQSERLEAYTPADVDLLASLANMAAIAIGNARLLAQTREQAMRVQLIIDTVPQGVFLLDREQRLILTNPAAQAILSNLTDAEAGDTLIQLGEYVMEDLLEPVPQGLSHELVHQDRLFELIPGQMAVESGGWVVSIRDVTESYNLQQRTERRERLALLGQLASGVAHDFNNLLTAINGYAELLLLELEPVDPRHADVVEIRKAAMSSASLTRQLLAFSRGQATELRIVNLNEVIASMEGMLRRVLSERVNFDTLLSSDLGFLMADPAQLEQVIMNLVVNAQDAMPQGGGLKITTANVTFDEPYFHYDTEIEPGDYVMLSVTDEGIGMDRETQSRIFEPFFTTKGKKGTGLGLATVYGIVRQYKGSIGLYSELGQGTTFKIYLPREDAVDNGNITDVSCAHPTQGSEMILVTEDNEVVRVLACRILERYDYQVLVASTPSEALDLAREHRDEISLLLTDMVMPEMGGPDLARQIRDLVPGLPVLFMSGYTADRAVLNGAMGPGTAFLSKPFQARDLMLGVRKMLDQCQESEERT